MIMNDRSHHAAQDTGLRALLLELIADGNRLGAPMDWANLQASGRRAGYAEGAIDTMLEDMDEAEVEWRWNDRPGSSRLNIPPRQKDRSDASHASASKGPSAASSLPLREPASEPSQLHMPDERGPAHRFPAKI
jgi:hypothetical protein